jgi:Rrf2 family protein
MLSMKAKYGLRALVALARDHGKGPVLIADLAASEMIPKKFLELILLDLKRKGILESKKGRGGGYNLNRPPSRISIGDVIRALDGPIALLPCVSQTAYKRCDECVDELTCGIRLVMKDVRDASVAIFDGTTLEDMLDRGRRMAETRRPVMYHI